MLKFDNHAATTLKLCPILCSSSIPACDLAMYLMHSMPTSSFDEMTPLAISLLAKITY